MYGTETDAVVEPGTGVRRWAAPVAGIAVVGLLFAYVLTHRIDPAPAAPRDEGPPRITAALDGPRGTVPEDLRVLVGGSEPAAIDARTGTLSPLAGLPAAAGQRVGLAPVPDGGVLATVTDDRSSRALLLRGGAATELGDALQALPLRSGGAALLTQGNGRTQVRLLGADGKAAGAWSVRGFATALRDTAGGLLLSQVLSVRSPGGDLVLVDPRTGADRRRLGSGRKVLATTDRLIASVPGDCLLDCPVTVADLVTGRERKLPKVTGAAPGAGALTADGELLALSVPSDSVSDGGGTRAPRAGFVTVLDLVDGGRTVVPGVRPATGEYAGVAWSPDGALLAVAVWLGRKAAIGLWSPARPREAPVVLPAEPTASAGSVLATAAA